MSIARNATLALLATITTAVTESGENFDHAEASGSCFESLCLQNIDGNFGGIFFEALLFFYCFAGLAIVCDKYLVVSLETLCVRWSVREDVAGATFMAFGSAAPEIIINALGAIQGNSDLGVGAIVGSGMIAFSVIPGLCAILGGRDLLLKRRPLARDSFTYLFALILLTAFVSDGKVVFGEAFTLFICYIIYVTIVVLSPSARKSFHHYNKKKVYEQKVREAIASGASRDVLAQLEADFKRVEEKKSFVLLQQEAAAAKAAGGGATGGSNGARSPSNMSASLLEAGEGYGQFDDEEKDDESSPSSDSADDDDEDDDAMPEHLTGKIRWYITRPLHLMFDYTCVACEHDGPKAKWYPLTFIVAFLWVAFFSFTISAVASRWNDLSGLPLSLFGIVLVSVGAEIPDAVSSITVAKRGYGSMAVSNSCGSQITNVLFGLGFPWFLVTAAGSNVPLGEGEDIVVATAFQFANLSCFICTLLLSALAMRLDKARLTKQRGYIMVVSYAITVIGFCTTSQVLKM